MPPTQGGLAVSSHPVRPRISCRAWTSQLRGYQKGADCEEPLHGPSSSRLLEGQSLLPAWAMSRPLLAPGPHHQCRFPARHYLPLIPAAATVPYGAGGEYLPVSWPPAPSPPKTDCQRGKSPIKLQKIIVQGKGSDFPKYKIWI